MERARDRGIGVAGVADGSVLEQLYSSFASWQAFAGCGRERRLPRRNCRRFEACSVSGPSPTPTSAVPGHAGSDASSRSISSISSPTTSGPKSKRNPVASKSSGSGREPPSERPAT